VAISTDDAVVKFGTADEVSAATPSSVSAGAWSVAADAAEWTNDDDVERIAAQLDCDFTSAPTVGGTINLACRLKDFGQAGTEDTPDVDLNHEEHKIGSFVIDIVGSSTTISLATEGYIPSFKTSQKYDFYIKNNTDQDINSEWRLDVTPKTIGPHA
jgi:hypothetical protein